MRSHKLITKVKESGLTLVPLSLYFSDGWAKVELGLARGKKDYDKRQDLAAAGREPGDQPVSRAALEGHGRKSRCDGCYVLAIS